MPPNNRLAPPLRNSLASYVPAPLDPNMLPPEVSPRFGVGDYAQNLSIGVGEGLTLRLKSAKQTLQDPVQAVKETAMAIRQMYDDPMLALQALRQLRQQIMSGPLGAGQAIGEMAPISIRGAPVMQELDVYHGTPHRFEPTPANPLGEFDASKIGTGEGAQAYGHGVYLAEAPQVAEGYKKTITQSMTSGAQRRLQNAGGDLDKAIADTEARAAKYRQGGAKSYAEAAEEDLRGLRQFKEAGEWTSGLLYKADLPDEMIDRMLDWDKPLKEQPANVQKFFSRIYKPDDYLTDWLKQGDPDSVAEILQQEGIPGIKYLDAGSRGQGGKGTRNFVVFPGEEKKVRILERK